MNYHCCQDGEAGNDTAQGVMVDGDLAFEDSQRKREERPGGSCLVLVEEMVGLRAEQVARAQSNGEEGEEYEKTKKHGKDMMDFGKKHFAEGMEGEVVIEEVVGGIGEVVEIVQAMIPWESMSSHGCESIVYNGLLTATESRSDFHVCWDGIDYARASLIFCSRHSKNRRCSAVYGHVAPCYHFGFGCGSPLVSFSFAGKKHGTIQNKSRRSKCHRSARHGIFFGPIHPHQRSRSL